MKKNTLAITILISVSLSCSSAGTNETGANKQNETFNAPQPSRVGPPAKPAKLDSYAIKGIKIAYYRITPGLKKEELIETGQSLHELEPDTQVIMVDDDSELAAYISFAKAISGVGELEKPLPKDWADKHIIANIRKYTSGKFVLCEGNGSIEIAELK
jgi:hypothetical protein